MLNRWRLEGCFNSRTPGGVRQAEGVRWDNMIKFQFTHPGRGATRAYDLTSRVQRVSIHAPREGCDFRPCAECLLLSMFQFTHPGRGATRPSAQARQAVAGFNSRTPGGVRHSGRHRIEETLKFQFTHPGRGATTPTQTYISRASSFNSRTPGGVRPNPWASLRNALCVSIHAPREGCDVHIPARTLSGILFQFTHPGRGATVVRPTSLVIC